ncbi:MAG: response regulator transcription factor [Bdellovibrionales bacterium]|nr:response regulator transcription factor [Bdellovibrionales bacterium]
MKLNKAKILVIEDNEDTRRFLQKILSQEYEALLADNAVLGIEVARKEKPALIILDIMLPHLSGLDACRLLKKDERTSHIPIIFLSAKGSVTDITSGLDIGADDYLPKPFDYKELLARVQARLRNVEQLAQAQDTVIQGDLRVEPSSRKVWWKGKPVELTLTEFDILRCLAARAGENVSRKEIIDAIRDDGRKGISERTIDVHIRAIRKKIPEVSKHLSSVYGVGYRYDS